MRRRDFILAAAAAITPLPALAAPGVGASQALEAAFWKAHGIQEGSGRGNLHVLFAPWCHVSAELWNASRAFTDTLSFRWIPFSGGQPEGLAGTEALLASPFPSSIPAAFTTIRAGSTPGATPLADAQDRVVASYIEPAVIRDSGAGLVSPTLVYRLRDGRVRVVRGGIGAVHLQEIAEAV